MLHKYKKTVVITLTEVDNPNNPELKNIHPLTTDSQAKLKIYEG